MIALPKFLAADLRLELRDPREFPLIRLYKAARTGAPGGEWEPPPPEYRNLRVDPPRDHKNRFAVMYTADTLACVAEECRVLQHNGISDVFQIDQALLAKYCVVRYAFSAPALFVDIDVAHAAALGLQPRKYGARLKVDTASTYDRYQAASLALFDRFGDLVHGLCWQSMHRGQFGRVYAIWHERKTHLQLSVDAAGSGLPLAQDADWKTFVAQNPSFVDVPAPGVEQ